MHTRYPLFIPLFLLVFISPSFSQYPTFGDLIPDMFLPVRISPSTRLDCDLYFHLADSINHRVFQITGVNPIPDYRCGNDTLSYVRSSIEEAVKEIPPGSILARMIIDRNGYPVCCKIYVKEGVEPGSEVANALSKLILTPGYRNGEPIPTECRFIYDFQMPKLHGRKIIE